MCLEQDSTVVTLFFEKELPDTAACSDASSVVVVFDGYLSGGQRKTLSITADRCNPYTYQFTAPRKLLAKLHPKTGLKKSTMLLIFQNTTIIFANVSP